MRNLTGKQLGRKVKELFELIERVPNWDKNLTNYEKTLALKFKEKKNFYEVGRELNLKPGNIISTLYGNTQKLGVITKIKRQA